ncbi:hypothetical protein KKC74_05730 [bacterium]|nr:hypothetical protein [bacterium]
MSEKEFKHELSSDINPLLRTTQQYHFQLSLMADQKANIIIAATSILFTISLTNFDFLEMLWGFVCLAAFSLVALIFAILAVYPSYEGKKTASRVSTALIRFFSGTLPSLAMMNITRRWEN